MLLRTLLQVEYGVARRQIISLIDQGGVFINQKIVENYKAELSSGDQISIPSLKISVVYKEKQGANLEYPPLLLFNKPMGYTCSKADPHNRTFYELLPEDFRKKYYYIGRLDKESRGLVLLVSDPQMVHDFEHPSKQITKEYLVQLNRPFDRKLEKRILDGISHEGEVLRVVSLYPKGVGKIGIVLNEGKKRHIRRIFKVLGYEVIDLQRIRIGNFLLGNLSEGKRTTVDSIEN
ncbi:MAG: rRNA pseudouridine synthase [candidate division SR1 bacterium]|nr:rRNA pseudouridine synthase [candidate division SR1 bacterium]